MKFLKSVFEMLETIFIVAPLLLVAGIVLIIIKFSKNEI